MSVRATSDIETIGARLEQIYRIGSGPGAQRPGFSAAEEEAHELVARWMEDAGLEVARDDIGNLFGRLAGSNPELPEIWLGSHLDSVPGGGRYDGVLGVVGALAALGRLHERPQRSVCVVALRDEEGWRFGQGCLGSKALTGTLDGAVLERCDAEGISLREALHKVGRALTVDSPRWLRPAPAAFLELHVEQGPVLAERGAPLGIVDSFVGHVDLDVQFRGRAAHAGTTPMATRRDAAACAARFIAAVEEIATELPPAVATVGRLVLEPGVSNVVPEVSRLSVDARAADGPTLAQLEVRIVEAAHACAGRAGCEVEVAVLSRGKPVPTNSAIRHRFAEAAPDAPLLPSGAGHDAQVFAAAGIPVGMVFVRSLAGGVSHSVEEASSPEDIDAAIAVLAAVLARLATTKGAVR